MGRGHKTDRELDLLDKLKHENRQLKRQLKAARKCWIDMMWQNKAD